MNLTEKLKQRFYKSEDHPYRIYEHKIKSILKKEHCLLDAGCGRTMPVLKQFVPLCKQCIGVDLEECIQNDPIRCIKGDISNIAIDSSSVDIVISRAVLEHVKYPDTVYKEIYRILKPGGRFVFLVPNLGDYVSVISLLIPNKYHGIIVSKTEGRKIEDVFPAYYQSNTYRSIADISKKTGFKILDFQYLGQYPSSFMFNPLLFLAAAGYEKLISRYDRLGFLRAWILADLQKIS